MLTLTYTELTGNRNSSKTKVFRVFRVATTTGSIIIALHAAAIGLIEATVIGGHPLGADVLVIISFSCNEIGVTRRAFRNIVTDFNIVQT